MSGSRTLKADWYNSSTALSPKRTPNGKSPAAPTLRRSNRSIMAEGLEFTLRQEPDGGDAVLLGDLAHEHVPTPPD